MPGGPVGPGIPGIPGKPRSPLTTKNKKFCQNIFFSLIWIPPFPISEHLASSPGSPISPFDPGKPG